ncbi:MAG: polyphosphate polymerase domain-containing protein [Fibrobacteres bacterium]|nr:polyphosphate polymerase domain-containing protein [Fibrobacterota bacterium]
MIQTSFTRLERYELKYHVPIGMEPALDQYLRHWCVLDPHSEKSPDGFYPISSLYLDSPTYTLLRTGCLKPDGRFNTRIRAYGDHPERSKDWHFEIKEKSHDQVTKYRGVLKGLPPESMWDDPDLALRGASGEDGENLRKFLHRILSYNLSPFVLTQYRRKAWFGTADAYARVTLDVGMRWREERGFDFSAAEREMRPSDLPERFDPGCNAVLEVKCARQQVPLWMLDMIRQFGLVRSGFSKFESAARELLLLPDRSRGTND